MIAPLPNQSLLDERPRPKIPIWMQMVAPLAAILRSSPRNDSALEAALRNLLSEVNRRDNRTQLDGLLGTPNYVLSGELFGQAAIGSAPTCPDLVECYSRGRLHVELWFRDGQVCQVVGFLMPTTWELLSGREMGTANEH